MSTAHSMLLSLLREPNAFPVFVTGAGISIASGIPPFRGTPDAVWEQTLTQKGTVRYFHRKPEKFWQWFLSTFRVCQTAKPNPGHTALAEVEQALLAAGKRCLTVTQNVDGLHGQAGTKNLIEVHGTTRHMRCTKGTCRYGPPNGLLDWDEAKVATFEANPCQGTLPRCECGGLLRPHVLLFDESYSGHTAYGLNTVDATMDSMTVVVFIGTSFSVTITDLIMTSAYQRAVPMFVLDPNVTQELDQMHYLVAPAEQYLPFLAADL